MAAWRTSAGPLATFWRQIDDHTLNGDERRRNKALHQP
jgi:hypothetical protein